MLELLSKISFSSPVLTHAQPTQKCNIFRYVNWISESKNDLQPKANDFSGAFDYDGVWYTQWFDVDENEDGVEEETIAKHFNDDRATMQKCYNPLDIEVMIKETFEDFKVKKLYPQIFLSIMSVEIILILWKSTNLHVRKSTAN